MKSLTLLICLIALVSVGYSQKKPCDLTLKDLPEIRKLKLGMAKKDAIKIFPTLEENTAFFMMPTTGDYENLESIDGNFYDGKLYRFEIRYKSEYVKWNDAYRFAQNLSENLKLPYDSWKFTLDERAKMECREFSIEIISTLNEIIVKDLIAEEKIRQSELQKSDGKQKAFKPK